MASRASGKGSAARFLAAWDSPALPFGSAVAAGTQEGPCATFPLSNASVDIPVGDGVVLIGDAAGWVDPLIGQGLSMAMRDTRVVAEVLLNSVDWTPAAFAGYVGERRQRLAKLGLLARIHQRLSIDFSRSFAGWRSEAATMLREHDLFGPLVAAQSRGPEAASGEVLRRASQRELARILGAVI